MRRRARGAVSPRRRGAVAALAAALALLVGCQAAPERAAHPEAPRPTPMATAPTTAGDGAPPWSDDAFLAPSGSSARAALATDPGPEEERAATFLADRPTATWLTPEAAPLGSVAGAVTALVDEAADEGVALALVVYGIPDRDCGGHSAGGLDAAAYRAWVAEIAGALAPRRAPTVAILEPDSLGLARECAHLGERQADLAAASSLLADAGAWVYLDGGHSGWLPPEEMAALLAGVDAPGAIRGFATNVANHRATADEVAYAHAVSALAGGLHAVIDTSRNGGETSAAAWCNTPGRLVGEDPATLADDVVDGNLWIKPPGESDGECEGGPRAGVWWPEAAIALTSHAE
ncbi:glycoside hydrolase family 6 protein [Microbacterium excoecariae]|uniref:glycoside hydrolase family 6 protein n=1 Tax=Microbacterium excoecariae TaxID=2715210 RepID=UPI001407E308|nr:glycoside hydrolase family 6 protein [Microbacterium excoecariae]